jgi:hypothetical protein
MYFTFFFGRNCERAIEGGLGHLCGHGMLLVLICCCTAIAVLPSCVGEFDVTLLPRNAVLTDRASSCARLPRVLTLPWWLLRVGLLVWFLRPWSTRIKVMCVVALVAFDFLTWLLAVIALVTFPVSQLLSYFISAREWSSPVQYLQAPDVRKLQVFHDPTLIAAALASRATAMPLAQSAVQAKVAHSQPANGHCGFATVNCLLESLGAPVRLQYEFFPRHVNMEVRPVPPQPLPHTWGSLPA